MMCEMRDLRFAHSEGHTELCYDESGRYLLTGGADGDVRVWDSFDDDDPVSHRVGDVVHALGVKNDRLYTAADDNEVCCHTFPEGRADGIAARFTQPVTHMCFSHDGKKLYAGASDFHVKAIELESNQQVAFTDHEAPILSVAVHPSQNIVASASCDGSVCIWDIDAKTKSKQLNILPKCNDISASKTLCRLAWNKDGKFLAIPVGKEVKVYKTSTWDQDGVLTDDSIQEVVSIVAFSPCGKYLAGACRDGQLLVWDFTSRTCLLRERHPKKQTITALAWNPKGNGEVAFSDQNGHISMMAGVREGNFSKPESKVTAASDAFAGMSDDDDDLLATCPMGNEGEGGAVKPSDLFDDDGSDADDDIIPRKSTAHRVTRIDDESRDTDLSSRPAVFGDDESVDGRASPAPPPPPPKPVPTGPPPTPIQEAFQPGSSPTQLAHRFMVWNAVGIIHQYNTEEENSVDIEFHDTSTHHAMHVTNTLNHSMAALSQEAVLLACEADIDQPSQLVCMHFNSWDSSKEWSIPMPEGEDIKAIALSEAWAAAATDHHQVRLFTVGGLQREVMSLSGPVVSLAAHQDQLMVVYHRGVGLPGNQNLGVQILQVHGRCKRLLQDTPLPLSPKSTLAWIGFSAEGSPVAIDSKGIVRMLNRKFCSTWTQVANLKSHCKGKSDNYWVVGIHENPQQIRCILCKGARYPPTLPRPNIAILPFQLPMCELATDRGQLEEVYWRHQLLSQHLDWWEGQGYDVQEDVRAPVVMPMQETLMKLFALACKTGREVRAVELGERMPDQHTVQLAIKYASRLRLMQVADRLNQVARDKAEQPEDEEEEDELEAYSVPRMSKVLPSSSRPTVETGGTSADPEEEAEYGDEGQDTSIYEEIDGQEDVDMEDEQPSGPKLLLKKKDKGESPAGFMSSQPGARKNPFKAGGQKPDNSGRKGSSVFDGMQKKTPTSSKTAGKSPLDKPLPLLKPGKKKAAAQAKFAFTQKKKNEENTEVAPERSAKPAKTGFQLWLEANREGLAAENPDLSETDLTLTAARTFKELPDTEKQVWLDKAKIQSEEAKKGQEENSEDADSKKRKREDATDTVPEEKKDTSTNKKKKLLSDSTNSKLASFAFNKS